MTPPRSLATISLALCLTLAFHPANGLQVALGGLGIKPLLFRGSKGRVVSATLLFQHAPRIFPAMVRTETLARSAVFPLGPVAPILCVCAGYLAGTHQGGKRSQNDSI